MKYKLGFSPCPNDTFIFDALINNKIDNDDLEFEIFLEDVETLNQWVNEEKLDITKLSFPALFKNLEKYVILSSGAALGRGVGPLLISKRDIGASDVSNCSIAIPGENTTANFLLNYAFPEAKNVSVKNFSKIEDAVLNEDVDLGVIIHENRFTYREKGLVKICDLGEVWEKEQHAPIPLGCIAVKRSLPVDVQYKLRNLIKQSVEYAFGYYPALPDFVVQHAQEMNEEVMRKHIELYVNDYTVNLGDEGKKAIMKLYEVYLKANNTAVLTRDLFLP
jgi:1,4-dihydroxy-6-naphthoate synthase